MPNRPMNYISTTMIGGSAAFPRPTGDRCGATHPLVVIAQPSSAPAQLLSQTYEMARRQIHIGDRSNGSIVRVS